MVSDTKMRDLQSSIAAALARVRGATEALASLPSPCSTQTLIDFHEELSAAATAVALRTEVLMEELRADLRGRG